MQFIPTAIPDVILIKPEIFGDSRGYLLETYQARKFSEAGIDEIFVQDNHSGSQKGTLRGLHYQIQHPQGKLIKVVVGEIFDVAVDIRQKSTTFGKWVGASLSSENRHQLWVPPGFAHGFYVISEWAEVFYKTTDFYAPEHERSICWHDPTIGVEWPLLPGVKILISDRDSQGANFEEAPIYK